MSEQLTWLATCGKPWAETRAQMALQMNQALSQGEISEDEYRELMTDLAHSDRLNEEADDLEVKNYLVAAIMVGVKFV